jgi:hypothetical protein
MGGYDEPYDPVCGGEQPGDIVGALLTGAEIAGELGGLRNVIFGAGAHTIGLLFSSIGKLVTQPAITAM